MLPQWIIEKKRDGKELSTDEIKAFINGYASGEIPDYQVAAFTMAVYFRGMDFDETAAMTDAMMKTGDMVDTSSVSLPTADKHSTGGIGDKVSLLLAPMVACCGVAVPMLSGRGLGITGGTLDKLESIPGYRTDLSVDEFLGVLSSCGCSIMGQTAELAPVDKKLYALRDVTGTVPSIPLISASIMSKKLAEGADSLVLDVKWGSGAFMKTLESARELARTMVEIGKRMDRRMTAVITDMNQPLGRAAGNAVEVIETVEALQGSGPADLMEVTIELSSHMLVLAEKASDLEEARGILNGVITSGAAFDKFKEMVRLHGGSTEALDNTSSLPGANISRELAADRDGYVSMVDAELIGRACVVIGAGRKAVTDGVDHGVGITGIMKVGEEVKEGDALAVMNANDQEKLEEALELAVAAFDVSDEATKTNDLIVEVIT